MYVCVDMGISRVCAHLFLWESNVSLGLSYPRSHCYNTCQCIAALVAMPSVVPLLLLEEGIIGKFRRETGQTETDRQLLLLATPIRLNAPKPLICFFDDTVALFFSAWPGSGAPLSRYLEGALYKFWLIDWLFLNWPLLCIGLRYDHFVYSRRYCTIIVFARQV